MKILSSIAVFLPLLLIISCGAKMDSKASNPSNLSIYGGHPTAPGDWLGVVSLRREGYPFCTGTLIHPKLVVTAAHCMGGISSNNIDSLSVVFGNGSAEELWGEKIKSFGVHPDFNLTKRPDKKDSMGYANDIAYIILEEDTHGITPLTVLTDVSARETLLKQGTSVTLVGYGQTETGLTGIKYEVDTRITNDQNGNEILAGANGKDTCYGDSGGPAIAYGAEGEPLIFGVTSRSPFECGKKDTIYGLIHPHLCWIAEASDVISDLDFTRSFPDIHCNEQTNAQVNYDFVASCLDSYNLDVREALSFRALKARYEEDDCNELHIKLSSTQHLDLENLLFKDLNFLTGLAPETLSLENNSIEDIHSYVKNKSLKNLKAAHNKIKQLPDFSFNSQLQSLDISHNRVKSLMGLTQANQLKTLSIANNKLESTDGIAQAPHIKQLDLYANRIEQLTGVENLKELESINFSHNMVLQIDQLDGLEQLREIIAENNCIGSLNGLSYLPKLETLELSSNCITGVQNLSIPAKSINLAKNYITDADGIIDIQTLESLDLSNNKIEQLHFIDHTPLESLVLNFNQIKTISGSASNLERLELVANEIKDISFVENLKKLSSLHLVDNLIQDYTPLKKLDRLSQVALTYDRNINFQNDLVQSLKQKGVQVDLYVTFRLQRFQAALASQYPRFGTQGANIAEIVIALALINETDLIWEINEHGTYMEFLDLVINALFESIDEDTFRLKKPEQNLFVSFAAQESN